MPCPYENWVRFVYLRAHRSGGRNPDFEIPGSKRYAAVWWALVCNSSCLKGGVQLGGIIPERLLFIKQIPGFSADFADFRRLFATKREKRRENRRMSNGEISNVEGGREACGGGSI